MAKYGKESRIQRAKERQKARDKRSNKEQILILDQRLGEGVGAKKEREKLTQIKVAKTEVGIKKTRKKKEKVID